MNSPTTFSPHSFSLEYRAEQHLLIGRWLRPVQLEEIKPHYEALLAAAEAHSGCRHWLLDVRRRPVHDDAITRWFGAEFSPRLARALGRPVAIAYFAMVSQDVMVEDPLLEANMRQGEMQGSHYRYFNHETEALAWLAQQP